MAKIFGVHTRTSEATLISGKIGGAVASTGPGAVINPGAPLYDTRNAFSNGRYTIPEDGYYHIHGMFRQSTAVNLTLYVYVGAIITEELTSTVSADIATHSYSTERFFTAGQIVDIRSNNTATYSAFTFAIERQTGLPVTT